MTANPRRLLMDFQWKREHLELLKTVDAVTSRVRAVEDTTAMLPTAQALDSFQGSINSRLDEILAQQRLMQNQLIDLKSRLLVNTCVSEESRDQHMSDYSCSEKQALVKGHYNDRELVDRPQSAQPAASDLDEVVESARDQVRFTNKESLTGGIPVLCEHNTGVDLISAHRSAISPASIQSPGQQMLADLRRAVYQGSTNDKAMSAMTMSSDKVLPLTTSSPLKSVITHKKGPGKKTRAVNKGQGRVSKAKVRKHPHPPDRNRDHARPHEEQEPAAVVSAKPQIVGRPTRSRLQHHPSELVELIKNPEQLLQKSRRKPRPGTTIIAGFVDDPIDNPSGPWLAAARSILSGHE